MKKVVLIISCAVMVATAGAQNRNAFKQMDAIVGLTVTKAQTQQGTTFTVAVAQDAHIVRNGRTQKVDTVDGFWLLSDHSDLGAVQSAMSHYDARSNTGGGSSAYGFETQLKNGIKAGQTCTFTYTKVDKPNGIDCFGFKVKCGGVPSHICDPCKCVPEPASMAAIGTGLVALIRRRRKK